MPGRSKGTKKTKTVGRPAWVQLNSRAADGVKEKLEELAELLSSELGVNAKIADAINIAVNEALERRGVKRSGARH